jgi:trigger factor
MRAFAFSSSLKACGTGVHDKPMQQVGFMQLVQKDSSGLIRAFDVIIPKADLAAKVTAKIEEVRPRMQIKGFRPGKVPSAHIRKMYGRSLMGEVIETAVQDATREAIGELRTVSQPDIKLDVDMEKVASGEADLRFNLNVEVLPEFTPMALDAIALTRPVAEVADAQVEEALGRIADQNKRYEAKKGKANDGDAVVIDFVGSIDSEVFEGGSAEDQTVVIGAGRFIPGFEEQLKGAKAKEERTIEVTFPADYPSANLAGKPASFAIKVKEVQAPVKVEIDDEFAKGLGFDGLDTLKKAVSSQLAAEHTRQSRAKAKRALLDVLDSGHSFDLPPRMLDAEFDVIWKQVKAEIDAGRQSDEDKNKSEVDLRAEYRKIAERRVRLGLVLAEIGRVNKVEVPEEEVSRALANEARQYPGQEREVIKFFQSNPGAMAQLRAPLFEERVVDFILARAVVTDATVDRETLFAEDPGL